MTLLAKILQHKREEVAERMKRIPLGVVKEQPAFHRPPFSLSGALRSAPFAVIAEVKKASPSKNVIRDDFDPERIAVAYAANGASAISVLTDARFFQGNHDHLRQIRGLVALPLLCKDFIVDRYQLYEAKAAGADAVLLIVAALSRHVLLDLRDEAASVGLECLVEVHEEADTEALVENTFPLVGINNRDLATFQTDLATTIRLLPRIPSSSLIVSESGIGAPGTVEMLVRHGVHAVLVGESLMREADPGAGVAALIERGKGAGL
jgi:indole-3-glycerol phosphate synthase